MSVSTVEAPQGAASQRSYFEREGEWAESGANWSAMEAAFTHRINVAMGLAVLPFWVYHDDGENQIEFRVDAAWR